MSPNKWTAIAVITACLLLTSRAWAQTTMPAGPAGGAATPAVAPLVAAAPTTQPGEDTSLQDALKNLNESMSREEIEALVKRANENRLKNERLLAAAEIRDQLYDPDAAEAAAATLDKSAKNTQQDNIDLICRAYAQLDTKFGKLYQLYTQKKLDQAAEMGKSIVNTQPTFLGAARAYIYARALEDADRGDDAADAYKALLENMYDRVSFAADAAMRCAQLYDRMGRGMYAMEMYAFALKNYGPTMDQKLYDDTYARVTKLKETYDDPLGSIASMMGDVKERLAGADSGRMTQDKERQIVALLDDLIKTAQDQESSCNPSGQKNPGKKGQGQGDKPGQQPGQGTGSAQNPSSPARASALRNGETSRAGRGSEIHSSSENGDWSSLPPDQQQRLEQLRQRMTSERYKDIITDYHKRISEEK